MPLYQFKCGKCSKVEEIIAPMSSLIAGLRPQCCGEVMTLQFGTPVIKMGYPLWIDRIDDIQRRETQNGGRMRLPHPKEVQAT